MLKPSCLCGFLRLNFVTLVAVFCSNILVGTSINRLRGNNVGEQEHINLLINQACGGNKRALEEIINGIQGYVYRLALRMLGLPADAEDATQEILIQVITNLASFRNESAFTTWVYRIAANH